MFHFSTQTGSQGTWSLRTELLHAACVTRCVPVRTVLSSNISLKKWENSRHEAPVLVRSLPREPRHVIDAVLLLSFLGSGSLSLVRLCNLREILHSGTSLRRALCVVC